MLSSRGFPGLIPGQKSFFRKRFLLAADPDEYCLVLHPVRRPEQALELLRTVEFVLVRTEDVGLDGTQPLDCYTVKII